jgi:hypothetical protein
MTGSAVLIDASIALRLLGWIGQVRGRWHLKQESSKTAQFSAQRLVLAYCNCRCVRNTGRVAL